MSAPLEQGETYQYRQTVTDAAGVLANAGTVTATVTLPDGTPAAGSPFTLTNAAGTGLYDLDYLTVQAGRHTILGSATGGALGTAVEKFDDVFHVELPGRFLIGFDDARTQLRAVTTITSLADREQLRWLCLAASDAVERDLDRAIGRRAVTETYDGEAKTGLKLRTGPVLSVTTVAVSGTTLAATDYVLDSNSSILRRLPYGAVWIADWQNVTVTTVVGMTVTPPTARVIALYLVQSLWQSSQQAPHSLLDESALEETTLAAVSLLSGLPRPLQRAYDNLRSVGMA